MSMNQIQLVCLGVLALGAVILIGLERAIPYRPNQPLLRAGFWTDFFIYSIAQSYGVGLVVAQVMLVLEAHAPVAELRLLAQVPWYAQVPLFLVLHDFLLYWLHRWQHASPVMWRTHEPHHTNTEVDWLAGSRASPLEILMTETMKYAPMILLGASPIAIVVKGTFDAVWGMYIHSNIDVRMGRLQYVINGPEMHRWHHAVDEAVLDKNLATKFAVWDWLFKSAYWPRDRAPSQYGLMGGEPKGGYIGQQLFSLRSFSRDEGGAGERSMS